jgi:hypothetical protein
LKYTGEISLEIVKLFFRIGNFGVNLIYAYIFLSLFIFSINFALTMKEFFVETEF